MSFLSLISDLFVPTKLKSYLTHLLDSSENTRSYSSFTPEIGKDICAHLNTVGGDIFVKINVKDNKDLELFYKKKLKNLYLSFNINPSKWVSLSIPEETGFKFVIISIIAPSVGKVYTYKGKAFYRENNEALKWSNDDSVIIKNRKSIKGQPLMEEYFPSNEKKKKEFIKDLKDNNVKYLRIGQPPKNRTTYYKYFTLDISLSIFRKTKSRNGKKRAGMRNPPQTMQFVEPIVWVDQYERRFYLADYKKVNKNPRNTPKLLATCVTHRKESEPAWQIYNRDKEGLGKRCVQFCFNQVALRSELVKNLKDCTIVEGVVQYLSNSQINTLHLSENKDGESNDLYDKYFADFSLDNFINLLLLKRTAFEHEQEVRIFIIDNKRGRRSTIKEKAQQKLISLDWLSILEGIKVDPDCSDIEINLLQDEINRLIEDSQKSKKKKKELRNKLKVSQIGRAHV